MIKIEIEFSASREDGKEFSEDDASNIIQQIKRDIAYGTFGIIPAVFWNKIPDKKEFDQFKKSLIKSEKINVNNKKKANCSFILNISEKMFPKGACSIQHLIGIMAGDLFFLDMPKYKIG